MWTTSLLWYQGLWHTKGVSSTTVVVSSQHREERASGKDNRNPHSGRRLARLDRCDSSDREVRDPSAQGSGSWGTPVPPVGADMGGSPSRGLRGCPCVPICVPGCRPGVQVSTVRYPGDCLLGRVDISGRTDETIRPVLVVHGEEDLAIPIETARQLCDDLSDCRGMVPVPGAAHASNMTHPEVVTPAIAEFLAVLD